MTADELSTAIVGGCIAVLVGAVLIALFWTAF
jgi:hypothetical protein